MSPDSTLVDFAQHAITESFTRADLQQLLRVHLDASFEVIVSDKNLSVQTYELLQWAAVNGRALELLDHLAEQRPNNADLAAVAEELRAGALLIPLGMVTSGAFGFVAMREARREAPDGSQTRRSGMT